MDIIVWSDGYFFFMIYGIKVIKDIENGIGFVFCVKEVGCVVLFFIVVEFYSWVFCLGCWV